MSSHRARVVALVITALSTGVAHAAFTTRQPESTRALTFRPISELQPPPGVQPSLIGGTPANPQDWLASFYSFHGRGACTSTLVGPRTLLTAAHCVSNGPVAHVMHQGQRRVATCTMSEAYDPNTPKGVTADWALCLLDQPITAPGLLYERVNTAPNLVKKGTRLLLTGFGCVNTNLTGGNDGVFRIGAAPVTDVPNANSFDIRTEVPTGQPTVCPGDSGGGAYIATPDLTKRVQVSVNSRTLVRLENGNRIVIGTSLLSSLSVPEATAFLATWSKKTGQAICGVSSGMADCRVAP